MAKKKKERGVRKADAGTVFGPVWIIGWLYENRYSCCSFLSHTLACLGAGGAAAGLAIPGRGRLQWQLAGVSHRHSGTFSCTGRFQRGRLAGRRLDLVFLASQGLGSLCLLGAARRSSQGYRPGQESGNKQAPTYGD